MLAEMMHLCYCIILLSSSKIFCCPNVNFVLKVVIFVKMYKIRLNFKITPGPIMNFWVFKSLYTVNVCLIMEYCN